MRNQYFSPLFLSLKAAIEKGKEGSCRIQFSSSDFAIIQPPAKVILTNKNPISLFLDLAELPGQHQVQYWTMTDREANKSIMECEGGYEFLADAMLWKVAWLSSHKGPPHEFDSYHRRFILSLWPNFTLLPYEDEDLLIAIVWSTRPLSLVSVSTMLNLRIEKVFQFFSAASSLGLIKECSNIGTDGFDQTQLKSKSIFRRFTSTIRHRKQS